LRGGMGVMVGKGFITAYMSNVINDSNAFFHCPRGVVPFTLKSYADSRL
jgi:hypothetical protein